jgi:hypothetical protein
VGSGVGDAVSVGGKPVCVGTGVSCCKIGEAVGVDGAAVDACWQPARASSRMRSGMIRLIEFISGSPEILIMIYSIIII